MVDTNNNNNNKSLLRLVSHLSVFSAVRSGDLQTLKNLFEQESSSSSSSSSPTAAATSSSSGGGGADGEGGGGGGGGGGGDHLHQSGSDSGGIPVAAPPHPLLLLRNDLGETALYVAADNNLQDVFNYLLKFSDLHSASIRSNLDMNPFHVACKRGHLGIVKELLSTWPVLCQICDSSNTSPLYAAAVQDHLDVVNAILDVDESCIRIVRKNGKTSLHTAARYGLIRIVKALLDRDPEIASIKDKKGQTALHMAVKGQDPSVVEELLYADSSILNARDKKGNTAVHIATRKCRPQIVTLLVLSSIYVEVNAINNQKETAMDLADKLQYGESKLEIEEALVEAGAKHARFVGQVDEAMELKRTVSDIKHEVHSQLIQNAKTHKRMSGIAKELQKLHREAVQNTTNSVTVVAVLFASIAFMAIFNLPGQYLQLGPDTGKAYIADKVGFQVFCLMNATSLFISLAVVVVQITLVAWDTDAQKQVVSVVNKLMWAACLSTCGAFLSLAFVVVGNKASWMAVTLTVVGGPILLGTLGSMCYFVLRQHFGISGGDDSQRRIKRASGRKSFSWSRNSAASDPEAAYDSDHERIYAL